MAPSSVVVPMENPKGISLLAVNDLNSSTFGDKNKAANPKRFTKAFLLKAQRRLGCIPWMANRANHTQSVISWIFYIPKIRNFP
ncbi:hypothetical protein FXO38_25409 [Capsicum annuum]|nr:hypothetical protein FXO38_25409 [Capsicum annuum]